MEITFITGNGFNFFISDFLNNQDHKSTIEENLLSALGSSTRLNEDNKKQTASLWLEGCKNAMNEYKTLFDELFMESSQAKGEYLLDVLDDFLNRVSLNEDKTDRDHIMENILTLISKKVEDQMKQVGDSKTSIPSTVYSCFYTKSIKGKTYDFISSLISDLNEHKIKINSINSVTTNYDTIVEKLICSKDSDAIRMIRNNTEVNSLALHNNYEDDLQIIVNNPKNKLDQIDKEKWESFENYLENSDTIILFGIGLESDPHILEALSKLENKNFIIITDNPSFYLSNIHTLLYKNGYSRKLISQNKFYPISTFHPLWSQNSNELLSSVKTVTCPQELKDSLVEMISTIHSNIKDTFS